MKEIGFVQTCTKTEAGRALLKELLERLLESPKMRDSKKLLDIARLSKNHRFYRKNPVSFVLKNKNGFTRI